MKRTKRVLPFMLAFALVLCGVCVGAFSFSAQAATPAVIEVSNTAELVTAFEDLNLAPTDTTIRLTDNIEFAQANGLTAYNAVTAFKITVDMNGKTITYRYSGYEFDNTPILLSGGTLFTFGDKVSADFNGGGKIIVEGSGNDSVEAISAGKNLNLTINDRLEIDVKTISTSTSRVALGISGGSGSNIVINNVIITASGTQKCTGINTTGSLVIHDGEINSNYRGVTTNGSSVEVNGGKIKVFHPTINNWDVSAIYSQNASENIIINGGELIAEGASARTIYKHNNANVTINGGTITSVKGTALFMDNDGKLTVGGGLIYVTEGNSGSYGVFVRMQGAVEVNGGTILGNLNGDTASEGINTVSNSGVVINGGSVSSIRTLNNNKDLIKDKSGKTVGKLTISFKGITIVKLISRLTLTIDPNYLIVDVMTDESGKIYLWTSATTGKVTANIDGKEYSGDIVNNEVILDEVDTPSGGGDNPSGGGDNPGGGGDNPGGGGTGGSIGGKFSPTNIFKCIIHLLLFLIAALYLIFFILYYFLLERKRLDFISFLVSCGVFIVSLVLLICGRCVLDIVAFIVILILLTIGVLAFTIGKKHEEKIKEANYAKHPAKRNLALQKHEAKQDIARKKFLDNLTKIEDKPTKVIVEEKTVAVSNIDEKSDLNTIPKAIVLEDKTLSESFKFIAGLPIVSIKISKATIADHLENKFAEKVVTNRRSNFISTGLPLADTHYSPEGIVYLGNKALPTKATKLLQGVCFVYVYELKDDKIMLLLKTEDNHAKEIKESGHNIYRSLYPKYGNWYMLAVDETFSSSKEVFDIIDRVKQIVETPKTTNPQPQPVSEN